MAKARQPVWKIFASAGVKEEEPINLAGGIAPKFFLS
jgi:hypothetical protein